MNKELWTKLHEKSKEELRKILAESGNDRTKSLTKYELIVKCYEVLNV